MLQLEVCRRQAVRIGHHGPLVPQLLVIHQPRALVADITDTSIAPTMVSTPADTSFAATSRCDAALFCAKVIAIVLSQESNRASVCGIN